MPGAPETPADGADAMPAARPQILGYDGAWGVPQLLFVGHGDGARVVLEGEEIAVIEGTAGLTGDNVTLTHLSRQGRSGLIEVEDRTGRWTPLP
ncbi:MAG: hypothetical protein AAFU80_05550 [Pseudomonadota bacterium]